jgi:serine/threonine-protein kinase
MDRIKILADLTLLPGSLQPINHSIVVDGDQQPSIEINRDKNPQNTEVKSTSDQQTMVANINAQNTTLPFKTFAIGLSQNKITPKVLESGDRLGKYVIDNIIGEGVYSNVYSAHHIYLKHQVAIKALKPSQKVYNAIFLQEAQVLALLSHNNIVRVIDADIWEEVPFIALERLIGNNLNKILHKYKCLTIERSMDLMEDIGAALMKQEENGILHLDIKPDNIFQRTDGRFCLYDYGLVGIVTETGSIASDKQKKVSVSYSSAFGTPAYMSPEQVEGKGDNRSDLFSFGLTIWESLVGYKPRNSIREMSELKNSVKGSIDPVKVKRDDVPEEL